jgi:hypothetical protein
VASYSVVAEAADHTSISSEIAGKLSTFRVGLAQHSEELTNPSTG